MLNFTKYDVVVISDYNKGFLREDDITYMTQHHPFVVIDTKRSFAKCIQSSEWLNHAAFIKLNNIEYILNQQFVEEYNHKIWGTGSSFSSSICFFFKSASIYSGSI